MKEKDEWIHYTDIEWDDKENNVFSVDTRDFHAGYRLEGKRHKDIDTIKKYADFFHSKEEVVELIDRYYNESGGKKDWRFFALEGSENWNMKYIRIWRDDEFGFIICDSYNKALRKDYLHKPVNKESP